MLQSDSHREFYSRLQSDMNVFQNFHDIYKKCLTEGYVDLIFRHLCSIFKKELDFILND